MSIEKTVIGQGSTAIHSYDNYRLFKENKQQLDAYMMYTNWEPYLDEVYFYQKFIGFYQDMFRWAQAHH